jgi:hypothetical protein
MPRIAGMLAVAPILDPAVLAAFRDRAAAVSFLLQLSTALGSSTPAGGAHTPSGTVPLYAKWSSPWIVDGGSSGL